MRIGIEGNGIQGWRGPSRNTRNTIRMLAETATKHELFVFLSKEPVDYPSDRPNLKYIVVPKIKFVPWLSWSLPLAVKRYHLDVMLFPQTYFWAWKPVKTMVLTRTESVITIFDTLIDRLQTWVLKQRLNKIADKIGAVSHYNAHQIQLSCGVDAQKFVIINNTIEPTFLDQNIVPCADYGDYILFCGGTEKRKNIEGLLHAYKKLHLKGFACKLVLVGGKYVPADQEEDHIQKLIKTLGIEDRVIIHGVERDSKKMAGIYRGAKACVYPSFQEDFGMVSIEAIACGCPLIASRMPSIPEIAGDAAEYFDPYDPDEMADKIEKVVNNEEYRQALIKNGLERAKRFRWEDSAKKMLSVLEELGSIKKM